MHATWSDPWLYIVVIIDFYVVPSAIQDTGSGIVLMLIVMTLVLFVTSIAYGLRRGRRYQYPIIVVLLFIPTIFIFCNASSWFRIISCGIIAALGNAFGSLLTCIFRKE
ncbi:hypothetical protein [Bifidobacterium eulemuris]|uniref:Exosortase n=1 Tax=Bifidobacterium eulemuris TaxID=1765219 RepID=A0A261GCF3_9BIFI|nr:hypothetical protein [Bifidobacterium eulemuris]OZG69108.1 exosortase [Bifidobacterium eulemuris]QOL31373.1 hypothetical protein BE0216_02035 [Bifidobacterium eulemuris]